VICSSKVWPEKTGNIGIVCVREAYSVSQQAEVNNTSSYYFVGNGRIFDDGWFHVSDGEIVQQRLLTPVGCSVLSPVYPLQFWVLRKTAEALPELVA